MADVELLPCPFCGSAPRFYSEDGKAVCVLCGECGASSDFSPAGREDEAAAAWNTRANLAPLQAEIEALRAEVEGWKEQHARDSAELRRICQHRDEHKARAERMPKASLDHSFAAFWRRHTTNHPEHRTRALRQLAYNAWRSGRFHESKAKGAAREDAKVVGTVLDGEFYYLRPNHGLQDGTMLYVIDQARRKENGNG